MVIGQGRTWTEYEWLRSHGSDIYDPTPCLNALEAISYILQHAKQAIEETNG